ncbi:MAG: lysophospholipid acyltransferase family protein [candidate division FCPU426 bacterium]
MRYFIFWLITRGLIAVLALLPHAWVLAFGRFLGRRVFRRMASRKQVAVDNLQMIYQEKLSPEARQRLAEDNFAHLGGVLIESLQAAGAPRRVFRLVRVEGEEHLRTALAKNKGLILFSGHVGNFILMAAAVVPFCDLKFLFRDPSQPAISRLYRWLVGRLGIGLIADNPRHACAYHMLSHIKAGGTVGMLVDQVETGGVYVDFMGKPAGSSLGAANLALRTGAPLIPFHCRRLADGSLQVLIEPELVLEQTESKRDAVTQAVAAMNRIIGGWVWADPEQWFWGHRRWRTWRK